MRAFSPSPWARSPPSIVEIVLLVIFAILRFLMRRYDYPVAPAVVGLILGPTAVSQLRRLSRSARAIR
jgi:TctA family transporter